MSRSGEYVADAERGHKRFPKVRQESGITISDNGVWERDATAVPVSVVNLSNVRGSGSQFTRSQMKQFCGLVNEDGDIVIAGGTARDWKEVDL
jgi:hypothetical protein